MNFRSTRSLLAASALALPFLTTAAAAPGRASQTFAAGDNDPVGTCNNKGVAWEDPLVVAVGPDECSSAGVAIEIGFDEQGQPITYTDTGCPEYISIKPGRNKEIEKVGMRSSRAGSLPYLEKKFDCTGQPLLTICIETGQTPGVESADNFAEAACEGPGVIQ